MCDPGPLYVGGLVTYVADLGQLLGLYWRSWPALGAAVCDPGPLLEPMLAVLSRSRALCWQSCAALGAYAGGLVPKNVKNMATYLEHVFISSAGLDLSPREAVMGRSWALCWQSWATLGDHVAGLNRSWDMCWRSWGLRSQNDRAP